MADLGVIAQPAAEVANRWNNMHSYVYNVDAGTDGDIFNFVRVQIPINIQDGLLQNLMILQRNAAATPVDLDVQRQRCQFAIEAGARIALASHHRDRRMSEEGAQTVRAENFGGEGVGWGFYNVGDIHVGRDDQILCGLCPVDANAAATADYGILFDIQVLRYTKR